MTYNVILYDYESVEPVRLRILRDYPCADGNAILIAAREGHHDVV